MTINTACYKAVKLPAHYHVLFLVIPVNCNVFIQEMVFGIATLLMKFNSTKICENLENGLCGFWFFCILMECAIVLLIPRP